MALREKQRAMISENEELKTRLRLFENDMITSGSKKSAAEEQMKKYIEQAQRQTVQIEDLSGKVNSIQEVGCRLKILRDLRKDQHFFRGIDRLFFEKSTTHINLSNINRPRNRNTKYCLGG